MLEEWLVHRERAALEMYTILPTRGLARVEYLIRKLLGTIVFTIVQLRDYFGKLSLTETIDRLEHDDASFIKL